MRQQPPGHGAESAITVLVCDDNPAVREMICIILEETDGVNVIGQAADGHEVVEEARRLQPDVIVLDLAMPRRSGLDALPDLRECAPGAKIVVLTGFASNLVSEAVFAQGALRLVEKGARPSVIIDTVLEVAGLDPARASDIPAP